MKLRTALNFCLIFVPLPIIGKLLGFSPVFIFVTACLGIIPLAAIMGRATEVLAEEVGTGLSGLVNATFGNACELILALVALRAGFFDVVKASITGSIIGNILLVLGGSVLVGGLKHKRQKFDRRVATMSGTLLALAAISLAVPAVFHYAYCWHMIPQGSTIAALELTPHEKEIKLAVAIATVQLIAYFLGIVFSLRSESGQIGNIHKHHDQKEHKKISKRIVRPLIILLVASLIVAWLSEHLVGTLAAGAISLGLNKIFIGVILVAIIGNAAEHSTAILMAYKNNMNLAMNIALSSGAQIALFVAPVIVFAGLLMGKPIDLRFSELELLSIIVSVIILAFITADGESNWLEGVQLLAVYAILGAAFYFAG